MENAFYLALSLYHDLNLFRTDRDCASRLSFLPAVPAFPVLRLIGKSAYVTRPKLLDYTVDRAELVWRANEVFGWLKEGKLNVSVDRCFPLDEAAEGHLYLEAGKSKGKVLYQID